jgi:hypothetical protein
MRNILLFPTAPAHEFAGTGLAGLPGWTLHVTSALPDGIDGATRWDDQTIWLSDRLGGREARFVLEHERQHVLRGPVADPSLQSQEESECDRLAAEALWKEGLLVDVAWLSGTAIALSVAGHLCTRRAD